LTGFLNPRAAKHFPVTRRTRGPLLRGLMAAAAGLEGEKIVLIGPRFPPASIKHSVPFFAGKRNTPYFRVCFVQAQALGRKILDNRFFLKLGFNAAIRSAFLPLEIIGASRRLEIPSHTHGRISWHCGVFTDYRIERTVF